MLGKGCWFGTIPFSIAVAEKIVLWTVHFGRFFFSLKKDWLYFSNSQVETNKQLHLRPKLTSLYGSKTAFSICCLRQPPILTSTEDITWLISFLAATGWVRLPSLCLHGSFLCPLCDLRSGTERLHRVTNVSRWVRASWLYIKHNRIKDSESRRGSAAAAHPLWR